MAASYRSNNNAGQGMKIVELLLAHGTVVDATVSSIAAALRRNDTKCFEVALD